MRLSALSLAVALTLVLIAGIASSKTLFFDNFDDNRLNPAYITEHPQQEAGGDGVPNWVEEDGVLKQTTPAPGDPSYCIYSDASFPASRGLQAKIRFDEYEAHDRSRAGLGLWQDENDNYNGYTFVLHNSLTGGNMQFLNDHLAWDSSIIENFVVEVEQWFYMKMFIDADEKMMYGKFWLDGEPEPQDWIMENDYTSFGAERQPTPLVGLNGGAGTSGGHSTCSFDDFYVFDKDGLVPYAVQPDDKLTTTWSEVKIGF